MKVHTKNTVVEEGWACRVQVGVGRADAACSPQPQSCSPHLKVLSSGMCMSAGGVCHSPPGHRVLCRSTWFIPKGQDSLHLGMSCSVKGLESTTRCYLLREWAEWEKHSIITGSQQEPETNSGVFCISSQNTFLWAE